MQRLRSFPESKPNAPSQGEGLACMDIDEHLDDHLDMHLSTFHTLQPERPVHAEVRTQAGRNVRSSVRLVSSLKGIVDLKRK
jgi:hypothetical protein